MKTLLFLIAALAIFGSCSKENISTQTEPTTAATFTTYKIAHGKHSSDKSAIKVFSGKSINVNVRFDSSAIYQSVDPVNQADINKLVGFSDGPNNHIHSARIGWNWSNDSLRLHAYSYMQGERLSQLISVVSIGASIHCTIAVNESNYVFTVNQKSVKLPRATKGDTVNGYWQYPYFGGDEVAPHDIYIDIEYL